MFWEIFLKLCNNNNESPNNVCTNLKLSNATATKWKNGSVPHHTTLLKIAEYFNVSVEYLLGQPEKEKKPPITENFTFEELEIINAYRNQPEVARRVVRRALGLEGISPDAATAAYGGKDTQVGKKME